MQKRGFSNPKKSQAPSILENEAAKMEEKIAQLKQSMNKEKSKREDNMRTSGSRWKTAGNVNPQQEQQQSNEKELNSQQNTQVKEVKPSSATSKQTSKPVIKQIPLGNKKPLPVKNIKTDTSTNNPIASDNNAITQKLPIQMQRNLSRPTSASSLKNVKITKSMVQLQGKENENNSQLRQSKQSENDSKISLNRSNSNMTNTIPIADISKSETRDRQEDSILIQTKELQQSEMTVVQFLESIQLLQYKEILEENGFDDLDTVLEINSVHMDEMKIPMGHQIKITKKIKALKAGEDKSATDSNSQQILPPRPISGLPIEKRTDLEELEPPSAENEEDEFDESYYYFNEKKNNISKGEQNNLLNDNNDLKNGTFNEEESHKTFLEALMEFRGQGVKEEKQIKSSQQLEAQANSRPTSSRSSLASRKDSTRKKSVRFTENISIDENKKSNEDKVGQPQIIQKSENVKKETGNQSNLKETDKCSCYNCFKLISLLNIDKQQVIHASSNSNIERYFCSVSCKDSYIKANNITCICGRQQPKETCFLSLLKGKWTCSQSCLEFLESEESHFAQQSNSISQGYLQDNDKNQLKQAQDKEQIKEDLKMQFKQENEDTDQYQGGVDLDFSSPKRGILSLSELEDMYKQK